MDVRWLSKIGISLIVGLLLSGCGGDAEESAASNSEVEPLFILSPDGVGPLNARTPFNFVRIGDAFQDLNVAEETYYREGGQYPVITVKQQTKLLLSINPDYQNQGIFSIIVHNNLVGNKLGHSIGDAFKNVYGGGNTERCAPGSEEWSGKVVCFAPDTQNVLYIFAGNWEGPDDQIPPLKVMADWELDSMVWKTVPRKKG